MPRTDVSINYASQERLHITADDFDIVHGIMTLYAPKFANARLGGKDVRLNEALTKVNSEGHLLATIIPLTDRVASVHIWEEGTFDAIELDRKEKDD